MLLKEYRKKYNISLRTFAKLAGYKTARTVLLWERGAIPLPEAIDIIYKVTKGAVTREDHYRNRSLIALAEAKNR